MTARNDRCARPERRSLDRIATGTAELVEVPLVLISVLDGAHQEILGAHGLATHAVSEQEACTVCRDVALSHKPIVVQDARSRLPRTARRGWGLDLVGYAAMPVVLEGGRAGALAAFAPAPRTWHGRDLLVLRSMAEAARAVVDTQRRYDELSMTLESRAADVAVETAERERVTTQTHRRITGELERISVHDELTGLLNRRGLYAAGNAQLALLGRDRTGLLLYIDVDDLKTTNDRAGHAAGDDLLHAAACVLQSAFGDTNTIARLGGDEFVVLVTDMSRRAHAEILSKLNAELRRCNHLRDPQNQLAWSLGLVSITSGDSLDALLSEGDRRMYAAKRTQHRSASASTQPS